MQSSTDTSGTKHGRDDNNQTSQSVQSVLTSAVFKDCSDQGLAVIVQNFDENDRGMDTVKSQCETLMDILQNIENQGFEIFEDKVHENLTCDNLHELCKRVAKEEFDDHYCLLFIILARGEPGLIKCQDKSTVKYAEQSKLLEYFQSQNCPSLALKPKMFIIQSNISYLFYTLGKQTIPCDPDPNQTDAQGLMPDGQGIMPDGQPKTIINMIKIPKESDFLIYTSDQHVYLKNNGFLESIIENLQQSKKMWNEQSTQEVRDVPEIQQLLIAMNETFNSKHQDKKVPCTITSLTKRMYLQRREI